MGFPPAQFKGQKMIYLLSLLILVFSAMMTLYHLLSGNAWFGLFIITIISSIMVFITLGEENG